MQSSEHLTVAQSLQPPEPEPPALRHTAGENAALPDARPGQKLLEHLAHPGSRAQRCPATGGSVGATVGR